MKIQNNNLQISKVDYLFKNFIEVKGGNPLEGHLKISGAKNSALVLMAASILSKGEINLFNVPQISDVAIMSKLLIAMGIKIKSNTNQSPSIIKFSSSEINYAEIKSCWEKGDLASQKRYCSSSMTNLEDF